MKKPVIYCCLNVLFLAATVVAAFSSDSRVCNSVTVRSIEDLQKLQNCSVVAGHVRLVILQFTTESLEKIEPLDIEEITEYLLIYRVHGLDTLEKLFPKLMVIRGVQLLYDEYSLVIHENRNLENIGLISLLRILRGSARIELNPSLCFVHTINWIPILGDTAKKYHYSFKNNKDPRYCPLCHGINPTDADRHKHCWSQGKLQKQILPDENYECYGQCSTGKCNIKGKCCSGKCLTSCSDENCRYCTNLIAGTKCVNNCIPPYVLAYGRQCVLDCHRLGLIRLGGECVEKCPKMYREVIQHDIVTSCSLNCVGNFTIKTTKDLEGFADCTILQGSLTLELLDINGTRIEHLEKAFMNLSKITGYFKIIRSPQLVSLNFMRKLHTIGGAFLVNNMYSLYVVDNRYLEELWGDTQKVSILKGRIYFHLNPRLCYDKITALESQLKESSLTVVDVSPNSNGDRIICGPVIRKLNATIEAYNANEARIAVGHLSMEELTPLIGYIYFYKEAPHRNITKYDARHGCGQDEWYADIVITRRRRHVLRNLKPYTQYAFYAKTFTITDFHYQVEAISDLHYFRTAPAKPGPVAKIYSRSLTANELELHWWPPRQPNGIIEKYLIHYEVTNHTADAEIKTQQANHAETCDCTQRDSETSGPTPLDEDYYEIEDKLYDDRLNNFIYVAKRRKVVNKSSGPKMSRRSITSTTSTSETTEPSTKISTNETIEESKAPTNASTGPTILTEEQFIKAHEGLIRASIREQDEGQEDYEISPVLTICDRQNPTVVYKKENNCTELDEIESNYQIDGNTHTFVLDQLQPEVTYRIGIRACVTGLGNGCGPETVIYAETVSKRVEVFLEKLKMSKVDSMSGY